MPAPVLVLLLGLVPSALMPISSSIKRDAVADDTRVTTRPAQPRSTAMPAIRSPTSAERSEPPPSTTRTAPDAFSQLDSVDFSSALSSKHFTVTAGPANRRRRPKLRNCTGIDCSASP